MNGLFFPRLLRPPVTSFRSVASAGGDRNSAKNKVYALKYDLKSVPARQKQERITGERRRYDGNRNGSKANVSPIDASQPYEYKTVEFGDGEDPPVKGSFTHRPFGHVSKSTTQGGMNGGENLDDPIHIPFNPYSKEPRKCILCLHKIQLDYKNTRLLQQFVSSFSGRVYERHVTGLCDAQQHNLLKTIAISRKAGFMPPLTKDPKFLKDPKLFDPLRPILPHSFD